ncbi:hypothetical protein [Bordetella petrii]|uniref:hypothetical protein n=1 Tax=Bordetella petrii TaxID=94624 RepID=UPI003731F8CB
MSARTWLMAALALGLAACTEQSQELRTGSYTGEPAYAGTGSHFVASGWTPGDKNSWLSELKVRTQRGQNEYNKVN